MTVATPTPTTARLAPTATTASDRRATVIWAAAAMVTVAVLLLVPLWFTPRFYFYGDTQIGSFGQWYHLGSELRDGHWPLIDLQRWRAGNYVAEGQWGQWNPLVLLISVASTFASNAMVFCTVLKVVVAVLGSLGGFLLCRSYGVRREIAFVVSVALPLGGVTQYLDLTTWATGLLVWALLPWAWWAIRRTLRGRNPFPALALCYLLVTVGYVYGTIYLALVLIGCLVDAAILREWPALLRVLGVGVCAGLLAVTVYLPGLLTAPVTTRGSWEILDTNNLPVSMQDYAVSVIPTGVVPPGIGRRDMTPLGYLAWFLPILTWVRPSRVSSALRPAAGLLFVLVSVGLWSLGPTQVGPLRYPVRLLPVVTLCALVVAGILASRATTRPTRGQLGLSLLWVGAAAFLAASHALYTTRAQLTSFALVSVAIVLVWWLWRRGTATDASARLRARMPAVVAAVVALCSLGFLILQHSYFPTPQSKERNMPALVSDYRRPLEGSVGDVFMVGAPNDAIQADASVTSDFLTASAWYVTGRPIQNTYTTIGFATYNDRYCITLIGGVCRPALAMLRSTEPQTGMSRLDLLSVSTVLIRKEGVSAKTLDNPPPGWRIGRETPLSVMWVRERPLPAAGGVVWSSPGTRVETLAEDTRTVRLRVTAVSDQGGTVAFSRLAWPGYRVEGGGSLSDQLVDGYLTTLRLPASTEGKVVTLHYDPPGWPLELAAWTVSVVASIAWSLMILVLWWRRRRDLSRDDSPDDGAPDLPERQAQPAG
jgi:membrane protein implicated in regulation of membrane protease activity